MADDKGPFKEGLPDTEMLAASAPKPKRKTRSRTMFGGQMNTTPADEGGVGESGAPTTDAERKALARARRRAVLGM